MHLQNRQQFLVDNDQKYLHNMQWSGKCNPQIGKTDLLKENGLILDDM